ncbi:MAG: hypothetical protein HY645_02675 [Acidobacteria bacterium]|nr:hypothetical protein [Acidobacteriota bacterium]
MGLSMFCQLILAVRAQSPVRVELGNSVGQVGDLLIISLMLETKGHTVTVVDSEVILPAGISFNSAEPGRSAKNAGAELKTELETASEPEATRLIIKVQSAQQTSLMDGILAQLRLKIEKAAKLEKDFQEISLASKASVFDQLNRKLEVQSIPGRIVIMKDTPLPKVACFFYMH